MIGTLLAKEMLTVQGCVTKVLSVSTWRDCYETLLGHDFTGKEIRKINSCSFKYFNLIFQKVSTAFPSKISHLKKMNIQVN